MYGSKIEAHICRFFPFLLLFSFSMFWVDLRIINRNTKGNETYILNSYWHVSLKILQGPYLAVVS